MQTINLSQIQDYQINTSGEYKLVLDQNNFSYNVTLEISPGVDIKILLIDEGENNNLNFETSVFRDSKVDFYICSINEGTNKYNLNFFLKEEGSSVNFEQITCGVDNNNHVDVSIINEAKQTNAQIWMRGVSKNAQIIYNPVGKINKGCDNAANFQESRVLLLDANQKSEVNPILLIDHFDVVAGHAASVSQVDERTLFYLQSRGIKKETAQELLMLGFVMPLLDKLNQEDKDHILAVITNRLTKGN